jgi:putative aminopeptidase FrvX
MGGFMIAEVARLLKEEKVKLPFGLYIVNSVQEEVGLRGAEMIVERIRPTYGHRNGRDARHADAVDEQDPERGCGLWTAGPVLSYGPAVHNNLLKRDDRRGHQEQDLPFQRAAVSRATGTDTDAFAYGAAGVPSALISLPLRYMHTTVESVSKQDAENVVRLITATLRSLKGNEDFRYIK